MSYNPPEFVPDDPEFVPDDPSFVPNDAGDNPNFAFDDDATEEQKRRLARLASVSRPLPGLELTPFEKMAQFVAPRLQQEDVRVARQIGTEVAGGVADAATTALRYLEMGTHPEALAGAIGEHAAGIPANQITSASPAADRVAEFVQRGLAGVGLNTPMPGPGLGEIIKDPARLLRDPVEIPQAFAKFSAGSAPYMLMPSLGGETAAARLARTLGLFSPMAAGEPLSRGDVKGALIATAQNALGLLAIHGATSSVRAVGKALGPPEFKFTPYDRTSESAVPEEIPPAAPAAPEPGPNLQIGPEKTTFGPVAQTALDVADRAARLKVAEAQGLTPDQQIAFATGTRGAESALPPASQLPPAEPLPAAEPLPESTQVPGVAGKLDRPVNNLAMAIKAVRLSETPEDLAWAQAQFDALKPGQVKGNPDVFEQELAAKRAQLEKNPPPATAPVPLERLPEVPAEAPSVPQVASKGKPAAPVPLTPDQADAQAYLLARAHHESQPQAGAEYSGLPDGSVSVSLPSGRGFILTLHDSIPPTQAAIDAYLKLHPEQTGMDFEGEGMSHVLNGDVVMSLSRAAMTDKAIPHEDNHIIEMLGLRTPEEHAALARQFAPGETDPRVIDEKISEAVENAPTPGIRAQISNTLGRFGEWLKTKGYQVGFVSEKPLPNVARLIEDARTGRALSRKVAPGAVAPEGSSFKLRERDQYDPIIQDNLVREYGTTDDNTRRGWILPDGRLVPLKPGMTHEQTRWNDNIPAPVRAGGRSRSSRRAGTFESTPSTAGTRSGPSRPPSRCPASGRSWSRTRRDENFFDLHDNRNTPNPGTRGSGRASAAPDVSLGQVARFYRGEELQQRLFKLKPVAKEDASADDFLSHAEISKGEHGPLAYRKYAVVAADTDVGDTPGNVAGRAALLKELKGAGYKPIESAGVWEDPTTHVRGAEPSLLVPGMDRETALALGKKYHQTAVVHIDPNDAGGSGVLYTGGEFAGKMKRWTGRVVAGADPSGHTEVTTDKGPFAFTLPTSDAVVDQPGTGTVGLTHLSVAGPETIAREGLKKRFAGTGAQGTERRAGEPTVWGYEPGTKPEPQVMRRATSVARMDVPGKLLRVGSPEYLDIENKAHEVALANDYRTPAESIMRSVARKAGYVGFSRDGRVKLFDDVPPEQVKGAETLTPELRADLESHGMFKLKPKDEKPTSPKMRVRDVGSLLDEINRSAGVNPEDKNWQEQATRKAVAEVEDELKRNPDSRLFYSSDIKKAIDIYRDASGFKELDQESKRHILTAMLATTSPGSSPVPNFRTGARLYEAYRDTGVIPEYQPNGKNWGQGIRGSTVVYQIRKLNAFIADMGEENTYQWLKSDHSIQEIRDIAKRLGLTPPGITGKADSQVLGALYFGPKTGEFFARLNGLSGRGAVIDMWAVRNINRYRGMITSGDVDKTSGLVDAPRNNEERLAYQEFYRVVGKETGLTEEETQAVLWYYEQELYTALGAKSVPESYHEGSQKYLERTQRTVPSDHPETKAGGETPGSPETGGVGEVSNQEATAKIDEATSGGERFKLKPKTDEPVPVWYSKLERAIEEKMPNSAPADQVRGIVKGAGVKPEEAEWSDLEGYLPAHPKADKARAAPAPQGQPGAGAGGVEEHRGATRSRANR